MATKNKPITIVIRDKDAPRPPIRITSDEPIEGRRAHERLQERRELDEQCKEVWEL